MLFKKRVNKKGVALFMVLATFFVVIILGNIILTIIASQTRLTHHQVSRIQAYYAAMAGINLALENLRTGIWPSTTAGSHNLSDTQFPGSIQQPVVITIIPNTTLDDSDGCTAPALGQACLNATVTYTYTP